MEFLEALRTLAALLGLGGLLAGIFTLKAWLKRLAAGMPKNF